MSSFDIMNLFDVFRQNLFLWRRLLKVIIGFLFVDLAHLRIATEFQIPQSSIGSQKMLFGMIISPINVICLISIDEVYFFIDRQLEAQMILSFIFDGNFASIGQMVLKLRVRAIKSIRCLFFADNALLLVYYTFTLRQFLAG